MRIILFVAAVFVVGCSSQQYFTPGIYHFLDDQEINTQISQTIRFEKDKTFVMYGIMKSIAKDSGTHIEYYNYVAFCDWKLNGQAVTLNTNPLFQGKPKGMLKASDMKYLKLSPWNYL